MTPVDMPPDEPAAAAGGAVPTEGDAPAPSYDAVDIMQVLAARRAARRALPTTDWRSLVLTAPAGMVTGDETADTEETVDADGVADADEAADVDESAGAGEAVDADEAADATGETTDATAETVDATAQPAVDDAVPAALARNDRVTALLARTGVTDVPLNGGDARPGRGDALAGGTEALPSRGEALPDRESTLPGREDTLPGRRGTLPDRGDAADDAEGVDDAETEDDPAAGAEPARGGESPDERRRADGSLTARPVRDGVVTSTEVRAAALAAESRTALPADGGSRVGAIAVVSADAPTPAQPVVVPDAARPGAEQPGTAPADAASVDAAPVSAASVDAAPVSAAPVSAAPVSAASVDAMPVDAAPVDAAPVDAASVDAMPVDAAPVDAASDTTRALAWLDAATTLTPDDTGLLSAPPQPRVPLLEPATRRRRRLAPTLITLGVVVAVIVAYCAAALLWPADALTPSVASTPLAPVHAPAAHINWPQHGAAGVQVSDMGGAVASTTEQSSIASITKLVTALMVLDKLPLKPGEQGPKYHFTFADRQAYWGYLGRNESSLNVPAGGDLTEYQMLQGMLIASASNYAARMAYDIWPNDGEFGRAATQWLNAHGLTGITITNPTGFTTHNTASPTALLKLAQLALRNPVIAQIVAQKSAKLPGAGVIENTNQLLLDDPGVVGVKTGTLVGYDLVAAKDVRVGGTTVRITAVGLNQPSSTTLWANMRGLFAQTELALTPTVVVPAGTAVGTVTTPWGAHATLTAAKDADAVLWNGTSATATTSLSLGAHRAKGQHVGTVTVTGPVDSAKVGVVLSGTIDPPTAWWRLTHPLQLLGRH